MKRLFVIFLILLLAIPVMAQKIRVTAALDTNAILIGEHVSLTLKAEYKTDEGEISIAFPRIGDTLIKEIEVISASKVERLLPDSNNLAEMVQIQTWIITSFDSGYYAIPPFRIIVNGDSAKPYETEALLLAVNTVAVDTTQNIKDIKPPLEVPFEWKEYLPYVYAGLAGLAVLAALIWFLRRWLKNRKKIVVRPEIIAPKIPAHVTALEQLEKLREEKLWQQGKLKEYHSVLSDIIRQYIEHRFFVNAMEQVTEEILHSLRRTEIPDEARQRLRQMLLLSDLVKFAKEHPLPHENESSLQQAIEFVQLTRPAEEPNPTPPAS